MQPYPRSPDLVWPGHLHGTGCLSARAVGTGFPTVVRRLCLGPVGGWVWVLLTPPVLAGVLGGCVWARFVALSLLCRLFVVFVVGLQFRPAFGTCVVSWAPRLPPAVSGSGVRCGRVCWARVSAVPSPSWLGCRGVFLALLFFLFFFFRALWSLSLHPLFFGLGWWLSFFFFFFPFRCPFSPWAAVTGLVLPVLGGWSPCASVGVLSSVPSGGGFGRLWWCWRAVWRLWAVFVPFPPLRSFFFWGGGGGLPVPPSAFPGLAHALACIQCCLPGCCLQLRSVWPRSGPMRRVGYVHGGLGAPSCRVWSWLCRLGGCARRVLVVLGWGAGVVRVLSPLRCRL